MRSRNEEAEVGSTGACNEVVSLTIERQLDVDCEPMTHDQMAEAFERTMEPIPDHASVDIDLRGSDAFAA